MWLALSLGLLHFFFRILYKMVEIVVSSSSDRNDKEIDE